MDLTRGYWQVPVAAKDQHKTAFTTPFGLFQFRVMPFGLKLIGHRHHFSSMQDFAAAYLDDLIIYNETWEDHLKQVRLVFQRVREACLTVKPAKCQFGRECCVYLGHKVGG